jgi:hypothetical protein
MSELYSRHDLSSLGRARLAKDGLRILCDARYQCSGVLGEVGTASAPEMGIEETLIVLPPNVAPQRDGTWRNTKRPSWRGEKGRLKLKGKVYKFADKPATFWGTSKSRINDYVLPVEIACPRCKRVNLITDALLPRL